MSKKNYKHKKRKIKYKNVFKFFLFVAILFIVFKIIIDMPITNIYIEGNSIYKDQEIIELAKLEDYPSSIKNFYLIFINIHVFGTLEVLISYLIFIDMQLTNCNIFNTYM